MPGVTFLDLFAGMGGFRLALERAGFTSSGYVETDKFARMTYNANFDTKGEWTGYDIRKITDKQIRLLKKERPIDIICGGFPCQAFSIAGKRGGFADNRGSLFFELCRFIRLIRPKHFILENVKGLLYHDGGRTYLAILNSLAKLRYAVEWQVLNSKHFGAAQNRERVIIIGHLGNKCGGKIFPLSGENGPALKEIIGGRQGNRVYSQYGAACTLSANGGGFAANTGLYLVTVGERLKIKEHANCLDANYYKGLDNHQQRTGVLIKEGTKQGYAVAREGDGINLSFAGNSKKRGRVAQDIAPTLTTDANIGTLRGARIRKLTPLECFRLQGFPDSHYHNAKAAGLSDSQLYKQAGNAVTVPVIYAVAKALMNNCIK